MDIIDNAIKGVVGMGLLTIATIVGNGFYNVSNLDGKAEKSNVPIYGTVLEESYQNTLSSVPEYHNSGLFSEAHSNETVKLDSKYTLKVKTDSGRLIGLSIIDGETIKKESLDTLIDEGTKISFPAGNIERRRLGTCFSITEETYFTPETQVGTKRADRIRILEK